MAKKEVNYADFSVQALNEQIKTAETDYRKMRFEHSVRGLSNPLVIRWDRREIARMKTALRMKQLQEATTA